MRLLTFTDGFRDLFENGKRDVVAQSSDYLSGLLMKAPRKNMERIEEYVGSCSYESMQYFLSESPWDHRPVFDRIALNASDLLNEKETAFIVDESANEKKGNKSAGVARQYNGRRGKVDNCQVGVYGALSDGKHTTLVDARLYLPETWTEDLERCQEAKIPRDECKQRSKIFMAAEIILHAKILGLKFSWVAFDAFYGASSVLLGQIDDWGIDYIADVRVNQPVELVNGDEEYSGQIDNLFFGDIDNEWESVRIEYLDGPKNVNACRHRVYYSNSEDEVRKTAWAVCVFDPKSGKTTYFLSNAHASLTEMVRRHPRRYWIERAFQDAKTSLGMADYQARGWTAWHHHMAMVALAQLFILGEKMRTCPQIELLSAQDIVEALTVLLPKKDTTIDQILTIITRRHDKRMAARKSKRKILLISSLRD